jgi:hypothetical protein
MTFSADIANRNGDVLFIKNGKTIVQEIKLTTKVNSIYIRGK